MNVQANAGLIDRSVRLAIGAFLLILMYSGDIGVWGWIGLVPLATGFAGWCPLYQLFGVRTCNGAGS